MPVAVFVGSGIQLVPARGDQSDRRAIAGVEVSQKNKSEAVCVANS